MSFNPGIVIPIYNHGDTIAATVDALAAFGLPIFVIDDGSDAKTQAALEALVAAQPLMRLHRLEQNRGKGAAVMRGMQQAHAAGLTHTLQIDADGQHDPADVSRFLALGAANPDAVICGKPIYDASAPGSRRYGRYLTHFWVWVETLSFSIADSMCGYRLYPLQAAIDTITACRLPERMDFDTEMLVRMYWRGAKVKNLSTRVIYPQDGLSHFDMLCDNWRISKMHTRLSLGMLMRIPMLLRRKWTRSDPSAHWSRTAERGGMLGMRILLWSYRLLGHTLTRALLYPIVFYYMLSHGKARRASAHYLSRVLPDTAIGYRQIFRHLFAFAESGLDKLAAWTGRVDSTQIDFPAREAFEALRRNSGGAVLIGGHLGNLEIMRAVAVGEDLAKINAVVYFLHAQRFNDILRAANTDFGIDLVPIEQLGPDTAILLKQKIDAGELLVITADRTPPADNGRTMHADFLGGPAAFPQGPFILASLMDCPVYSFFCLKEAGRYRIHLELFAERIELPRATRQAELAMYIQRYARCLEALCLRAPYQWFNFYDFWREGAKQEIWAIEQANQ